jgi:hypothetical protein
MTNVILCGDNLELMRQLPDKCVDLVFTSPPYEAARTYGVGFDLKGQEWVDWAVERFIECLRVCKGLVAWNVEGQTRQYKWSATPALFMADLHRRGVNLRKPPIFSRVGIPGSGGPDWLRNDYEFIVCATEGKLPWSANTAMGHEPKYAPGGQMSHRLTNGSRKGKIADQVERDGAEPKVAAALANGLPAGAKLHTKNNGSGMRVQCYVPPAKANPGNIIKLSVGGGRMGSALSHENEAPFPNQLAEFFIRSFCPEGGVVLDPFCGSGTCMAVAEQWGRKWIGMDIRESQVELSYRRVAEVTKPLFVE